MSSQDVYSAWLSFVLEAIETRIKVENQQETATEVEDVDYVEVQPLQLTEPQNPNIHQDENR